MGSRRVFFLSSPQAFSLQGQPGRVCVCMEGSAKSATRHKKQQGKGTKSKRQAAGGKIQSGGWGGGRLQQRAAKQKLI